MENSERRKRPRIRPPRLMYIQFGHENGGIVLDASLDGLGFQLTAPVENSQLLDFTISPSPNSVAKACGKTTWTSQDGKNGGLQFSDLSAEASLALTSWLTAPIPDEAVPDFPESHTYNDDSQPEPPPLGDAEAPAPPPSVHAAAEPAYDSQAGSVSIADGWFPGVASARPHSLGVSQADSAPIADPELPAPPPPAPAAAEHAAVFSSAVGPVPDDPVPDDPAPVAPPPAGNARRPRFVAAASRGLRIPGTAPLILGADELAKHAVRDPAPPARQFAPENAPSSPTTDRQAAHPKKVILPPLPHRETKLTNLFGESFFTTRAAMALLAAILLLVPMKYAFSSRHSLGLFLIHLGQRVDSSPASQVQAPAPTPPSAPALAGESAPEPAAPNAAAATPVPHSGRTSHPDLQVPTSFHYPGKSSHEPPLNSAGASSNGTAANGSASELWRSVGDGSTNAELALAKRYLAGFGGVQKNCEQARVLLFAAAKRGNSEAARELRTLSQTGCR